MLRKKYAVCWLFALFISVYAGSLREYKIDTNHSTVGFSVPILGGLSKVTGKFSDFNIVLMNDEQDITKSTVKAVIKTVSIDTGIQARDEHLRTPDFFDAVKFPEITFESTQIKKKGKNFVAVGNLTIHGITKQIELPFNITGTFKKDNLTNVGYAAKIVINRRDFGVNWTHPTAPEFVGDNVEIDINLITKAIKN
jgi:polyisoprenoid-binding protein YceI